MFLNALEDYASENGGLYPVTFVTLSAAGNTIIDLLPGGILLINPVTGWQSEPIPAPAMDPGQVGYFVGTNLDGLPTGYYVNAFGEDGTQIYELRKDAL